MESSWHRGVWTYGLGGTTATLAAPYLLDPTRTILTNELLGPSTLRTWLIFPGTELPWIASSQGVLPGHPHFPYGYGVPPDSPL